VLKSAQEGGQDARYTLEVFGSLRVENARFDGADYERTGHYVAVSRWIGEEEMKKWMANGGTYIPAGIGAENRVYVTLAGVARPGGTGPIRVDFYVKNASLSMAGGPGWRQIFQPVQHMPIHNVSIHLPQ
jgi:hypothetical protein